MRCIQLTTVIIIMTMNRITKKAALGGPSSDEIFPLREKTKFSVLLLESCSFVWWYNIYDRPSVAPALQV